MKRSDVPCNGCTACCERDVVFLHPEHGDRADDYETVEAKHPLSGKPGRRLAHKPEGGCIYLVPGVGCSIHERAPAMCRQYDCRKFVLAFERKPAKERNAIRKLISKPVLVAGRKRLRTLKSQP